MDCLAVSTSSPRSSKGVALPICSCEEIIAVEQLLSPRHTLLRFIHLRLPFQKGSFTASWCAAYDTYVLAPTLMVSAVDRSVLAAITVGGPPGAGQFMA